EHEHEGRDHQHDRDDPDRPGQPACRPGAHSLTSPRIVRSRRSIRKVDRRRRSAWGARGGHNAPSGREEAGEVSDDVATEVETGVWIAVLAVTDLADRKPVKVDVDGSAVLLVRNGEELFAIGNRCTPQGAPLDTGARGVG